LEGAYRLRPADERTLAREVVGWVAHHRHKDPKKAAAVLERLRAELRRRGVRDRACFRPPFRVPE
jgi:hypothetical protein